MSCQFLVLGFMLRLEVRVWKLIISLEPNTLSHLILSRKIIGFEIFYFFISDLFLCELPVLFVSLWDVERDASLWLKLSEAFWKLIFFVFVGLPKLKNLLFDVHHFRFLKILWIEIVFMKVDSNLVCLRIHVLVHTFSNECHWRVRLNHSFLFRRCCLDSSLSRAENALK